jgi:tetratricopeptide (TPR) repeat protein
MRKLCVAFSATLIACVAAHADIVRVGRVPYTNVRIVNAAKGKLTFQFATGRRISKSVSDVTHLSIDGRPHFNRAEEFLVKNEITEAIAAYDEAMKGASDWYERLVRYRRLAALDRNELISRATEEWLFAASESQGAPEVLKLRPRHFPPKGSSANADAIALLEAKVRRGDGDTPYAATVNALLLELYQHEGRLEAAAKLAQLIASGAVASTTRPSPHELAVAQFNAMKVLIDQGESEQVLKSILGKLERDEYPPEQLPGALLLAGEARWRLALEADEPQRRKLLIRAGLDFMRVATFFAGYPQASEALLGAGRVNAELGNRWAASNAYRAVIKRYPDSEAVEKARDALKAMK